MVSGKSASAKYPEWQAQYEAAVLELNLKKLPERIQAAQNAIASRRQALSAKDSNSESEIEAMENALRALAVLTQMYR